MRQSHEVEQSRTWLLTNNKALLRRIVGFLVAIGIGAGVPAIYDKYFQEKPDPLQTVSYEEYAAYVSQFSQHQRKTAYLQRDSKGNVMIDRGRIDIGVPEVHLYYAGISNDDFRGVKVHVAVGPNGEGRRELEFDDYHYNHMHLYRVPNSDAIFGTIDLAESFGISRKLYVTAADQHHINYLAPSDAEITIDLPAPPPETSAP